MSDIPDTGNTIHDIQHAVYDYYETYSHSVSKSREKSAAKNGTLSSNFIMFQPRFSGTLTSWTKAGRKKTTRIRSGDYNALYDRLKDKPDAFILTVGVLDDEKIHNNVFGYDNISYGLLFDCLKAVGYDPLWPIRKDDYIEQVERRMGSVLLKEFSRKDYTTARGLEVVKSIGRDAVHFVKDFIAAGRKPPLARKTIYTREWKDSVVPDLYPNGIEEPLSESGQLEEAIDFDVEVFETQAKSDYEERKKEARAKAERSRKKKRENARRIAKQRKIEKRAEQLVKRGKAPPKIVTLKYENRIDDYLKKIDVAQKGIKSIDENFARGLIEDRYVSMVNEQRSKYEKEITEYTALAISIAQKYGIPLEQEG